MAYHNLSEVVQMIAERRREISMAQTTAAKAAGVTNVYWCNVERGNSPPPELDTLIAMAAAVGIEVSGPVQVWVKGQ